MEVKTKRGLLLLAALAWSLRYDYLASGLGLAGCLVSDLTASAWLLGAACATLVLSWVPVFGESLRWRAYREFHRYATKGARAWK